MKISYFDKKLNKSDKELNLDASKVNLNLVLQNLRVLFFNSRTAMAVTKTKAEVSGGGKKPWRQKGTGRARTGSIRNPHWVGGGVSHGPRNVNWNISMSKKMAKKAFRDALAIKATNKTLNIVEFDFKAPKTKELTTILNTVNLEKNATTAVILNKEANVEKSAANLKKVYTVDVNSLNVKDIVSAKNVIISEKALSVLSERLNNESNIN